MLTYAEEAAAALEEERRGAYTPIRMIILVCVALFVAATVVVDRQPKPTYIV